MEGSNFCTSVADNRFSRVTQWQLSGTDFWYCPEIVCSVPLIESTRRIESLFLHIISPGSCARSGIPLALQSPIEISLGLLGVSLAVRLSVVLDSLDDHPIVLFADAVGLAAFATTGAIVATNTGVSAFGVIAVATINAVGGGAFADILLDRSPFILLDDFYASCAVLGGSAYWLVVAAGGTGSTASAVCAAVTVGIRLVAINYGWELPTAQMLQLVHEETDNN